MGGYGIIGCDAVQLDKHMPAGSQTLSSKGQRPSLSEGAGPNRAEVMQRAHYTPLSSTAAGTGLRRYLSHLDGGQFIALLLTVFAVAPLMYPDFFQSHSGFLTIFNLYDLERNAGPLSLGWMPTVGHAFDLFRGAGALPYAVAEVFAWLGLSGPQAIMASYSMSFLVGTWAMYRWTRRWLGNSSALLAAMLYTYMPYHLTSIYVRGSLADAWVQALLPLTLWAADCLGATSRRWAHLLVLLVCFALLCATQLGPALLWLPILAGYIWFRGHLGNRLAPILTGGAVLAGICVALVWGNASSTPDTFDASFPYLFQLLSPAWNVTGQASGWLNAIPLQIGLASLGLGLLAMALLVLPTSSNQQSQQTSTRMRTVLWYWLLIAGLTLLLMQSPLRVIWRLTAWDRLLTYPWQVMGFPRARSGSSRRSDRVAG